MDLIELLKEYIKPELIIVAIVLYFIGIGIKNTEFIKDKYIPIILGIIGVNMIREAFSKNEEINDKLDFKNLSILGIATSIDALIIGITFAIMNVNILIASLIIFIVTFIMSIIGLKIGNIFGCKFEKKAEFLGGVILILIGIKILLEHLNIIC